MSFVEDTKDQPRLGLDSERGVWEQWKETTRSQIVGPNWQPSSAEMAFQTLLSVFCSALDSFFLQSKNFRVETISFLLQTLSLLVKIWKAPWIAMGFLTEVRKNCYKKFLGFLSQKSF